MKRDTDFLEFETVGANAAALPITSAEMAVRNFIV
jgi:hypothetical protein